MNLPVPLVRMAARGGTVKPTKQVCKQAASPLKQPLEGYFRIQEWTGYSFPSRYLTKPVAGK